MLHKHPACLSYDVLCKTQKYHLRAFTCMRVQCVTYPSDAQNFSFAPREDGRIAAAHPAAPLADRERLLYLAWTVCMRAISPRQPELIGHVKAVHESASACGWSHHPASVSPSLSLPTALHACSATSTDPCFASVLQGALKTTCNHSVHLSPQVAT